MAEPSERSLSAAAQARIRALYPELSERCHLWLESRGISPWMLIDLAECEGMTPEAFLDSHTRATGDPAGGSERSPSGRRGCAKLSLVAVLPDSKAHFQ